MDLLLRFLSICTAAFLSIHRKMTDEYPTLQSEWQVKCPRNCLDPATSWGNAGRGSVFFSRVTLCANELESQVKPKLAPRVSQCWSKNMQHSLPSAPADWQPLLPGTKLRGESRKRFSFHFELFLKTEHCKPQHLHNVSKKITS